MMSNRPWLRWFFPHFFPLLALLFFLLAAYTLWSHLLDDAFVSLQYARNLATGQGLVFNPGERVEGFSNPLWVFALTTLGSLGVPWTTASRLLGLLAGLGLLAFGWWWLRALLLARGAPGMTLSRPSSEPEDQRKRSRRKKKKGRKASSSRKNAGSNKALGLRWVDLFLPAPALAMALVALHPGFGYYAVAGLETTLYGLLALLGVGLHLLDLARRGAPTSRLCYLPLAAAAITRPEGVLFLGAVALHRFSWLWRRWHQASASPPEHSSPEPPTAPPPGALFWREATGLGLALAVPLLYLGFRVLYYGEWLPNTYYAKPGTFWQAPAEAFAHLTGFLRGHVTAPPLFGGWQGVVSFALWMGGLALAGLAVASLWRGPARREARFLFGVVALYTLFILYTGGDWMAQYRFFQPILPLLYALPALGLAALPGRWRRRFALFLLLLLPLFATQAVSFWRALEANRAIDHAHRSQNNIKMARWMARHLQPDATILADEIGAIGFYSGLRVLDLWGLIDRRVARILHRHNFNPNNAVPPRVPANHPVRKKVQRLLAQELLQRKPEYVLIDYDAPVPRGTYQRGFVNRLTMQELHDAIRHSYTYVRGFSMMILPFKTFLLFRRADVPPPRAQPRPRPRDRRSQ